MSEIKIFVADDVSESGLEPLRAAGFDVLKRTVLKGDELSLAVRDCDGLIVRSETKVTAALMESAERLRVIGRAGVGVDNIDVGAATARGLVVINAPDGNTITTAEHTIAMLIALARRVPQANASLKSGRWERKRFIGVELRGKTLGIVGLGRIGRVVASRMLGGRDRIAVGRVHDDNSARRRRPDIYVINAYACASHDSQARGRVHQFSGHFRFAAHHQPLAIAHGLAQLITIKPRSFFHRKARRAERLKTALADIIGNKYLHLAHSYSV